MLVRSIRSHLLCGSRNGGREAALLQYASLQSQHPRRLQGALLPPSTPLPQFLVFPSYASAAAAFKDGGQDPSASASPEATTPPPVVEHLIRSCGFSPDEASRVCKRLNVSTPPRDPESVISFLKGKVADEALVKSVVSRRPMLLYTDVEKTLAPKFRVFEEMGLSGRDLLKTMVKNSSLLCYSPEKKLMPNISLLREECGISRNRILRLLKKGFRAVGRTPSSLKEVIERVRELGIPQGSAAFEEGLRIIDAISRSAVNKKLATFKSLGWTEEQTLSAIRRYPVLLGLTERRIKDSIDSFVEVGGSNASFLAARPGLLLFSVEKRVKPRCTVHQILRLKHLPEGDWTLHTLLSMPERDFLDKVILKYVDSIPELKEAYGTD